MRFLVCLGVLFAFMFANPVSINFTDADIKSCAYSDESEQLAIFDTKNLLTIIDTNTQKSINSLEFRANGITSLAFFGQNLYAGFENGEILKFSPDYEDSELVFDTSILNLNAKISHLHVSKKQIYAVVGKNTFISYDTASKKLMQAKLQDVYQVSTCSVTDDKAIVTSWDRAVWEINLANFETKKLFKTGSVVLSAVNLGKANSSKILLGLSNGEAVNLKSQTYKISNSRIKSILALEDKVLFGLGNGEIYKSDINLTNLKHEFLGSSSIIKIFNFTNGIITVCLDGEIKFYFNEKS